jgi:hypothetical protein
MKSETHRRFARLTEWLKGVEGLSVAERAAADRLLAELGRKRTVEIVPQCQGSSDQWGNPMCDGTDVRPVIFRQMPGLEAMGANWCGECRARAQDFGWTLESVGQVLPPKPTSYPCKNPHCSVGGKPRRVTRQGEYCTTSCLMENLNESKEANR